MPTPPTHTHTHTHTHACTHTHTHTQARDGTLAIEDMDGGTFTVSNGGVFGSMFGTPIINPPQSAILGMHAIIDRPMAVNGKVQCHSLVGVVSMKAEGV